MQRETARLRTGKAGPGSASETSVKSDSHLQSAENARVLHALMSRQLTETTPEDIEVPQNLKQTKQHENKELDQKLHSELN